MFSRKLIASFKKIDIKKFSTDINLTFESIKSNIKNTKESERMKKFREMMKTVPENQVQDPLLIEIDPETGEFLPESEQEPTKWGDWQHGGRVSDF